MILHLITSYSRHQNLEPIYYSIINLVQDFKWHIIEGSNKLVGKNSFDFLDDDHRVVFYKTKITSPFGHEQKNFFIENVKGKPNDWCHYLDDDTTLTQDLVDTLREEDQTDTEVVVLSQKKGLTEQTRLFGKPEYMTLGCVDTGSITLRYRIAEQHRTCIDIQGCDGHYAVDVVNAHNRIVKYFPDRYVRYNTLARRIS
jgi:hypothetical protein